MEKIGEFLKLENINSEEKFDCMFGDHSKRFKRTTDREYDPWDFMPTEKFDQINAYVTKLNQTIWNTHGIALPDNYIRERGFQSVGVIPPSDDSAREQSKFLKITPESSKNP